MGTLELVRPLTQVMSLLSGCYGQVSDLISSILQSSYFLWRPFIWKLIFIHGFPQHSVLKICICDLFERVEQRDGFLVHCRRDLRHGHKCDTSRRINGEECSSPSRPCPCQFSFPNLVLEYSQNAAPALRRPGQSFVTSAPPVL